MNEDQEIYDFAVAMIYESSMHTESWRNTRIGELHPDINEHFTLESGELVLVSCYFSDKSWYVFSTRRIVSTLDGSFSTLDPKLITDWTQCEWGNAMGYPPENNHELGFFPTEIATIINSASSLQIEFETGAAWMAPIHTIKYWSLKHRIRHKLIPPKYKKPLKGTT